MKRVLLIAVVAAALVTKLDAQIPPRLAQQPALGATQIVFVFGGDLWSVPRQGGDARRLTVGAGLESDPAFSPDGRWIAFTGQYDGNTDVFVMAAEGGVPRRLTWHPAPDRALGWSRDRSRILFSSPRHSYSDFAQLFLVRRDGGFEERLPLPTGYEAGFSSDGGRLAYVPLPRAFDVWKRYRGGRATPIWIADLSTSRVEKLPRTNSNDFAPMWIDSRIFFLSDRNGRVTLFSYDTRSRRVTQALGNDGMDFKSASAGPGGIVIEQFGQLHLYDLASGRLNRVDVRLAGDMLEVRPKLVNVGRRLASAHISPTGARALFEARGEIVTVPAAKGDARNLTETPGVMERDPAWSPDGARIAYFSDADGEYALHVRNSAGGGEYGLGARAGARRLEQRPDTDAEHLCDGAVERRTISFRARERRGTAICYRESGRTGRAGGVGRRSRQTRITATARRSGRAHRLRPNRTAHPGHAAAAGALHAAADRESRGAVCPRAARRPGPRRRYRRDAQHDGPSLLTSR